LRGEAEVEDCITSPPRNVVLGLETKILASACLYAKLSVFTLASWSRPMFEHDEDKDILRGRGRSQYRPKCLDRGRGQYHEADAKVF